MSTAMQWNSRAERPDGRRVDLPVAAGAVQQDHRGAVLAARLGDPGVHPVHVDPPLAELNIAQPRPQAAVLGPVVVQGVTAPFFSGFLPGPACTVARSGGVVAGIRPWPMENFSP